ncbi:metallophosphoesterase [Hymenobacter aerophilus]|uniref:metallophosphoesterase n=1 Tax=Hymenobacter aerophilus TaxID=119644 RepID=UPI00037405DB|nr:metallophosphoesterase [Hymenobacter aerophilus]
MRTLSSFFRVAGRRGWSYSLLSSLLLAASPLAAQRFAAIGDYGYAGAAERDVSELVKSWNPEFIITLGDNNYDLGDSTTIDQNIGQYYHAYIHNYKGRYGPRTSTDRFFPSLGNHDYYTRNGQAYRDYFTLPGNGRYYEFVRGDVHLFALNSDPAEPDGIKANSVQAQWLKERMAASRARWKVVYFHHAPYTSGLHGPDADLQWPFREWGASVVLTGHDHIYERLQLDGLTYFVNGLGGRNIHGTRPARRPESQVLYNADYGAMLLNATPDSLTLQFITRTRRVIDTHVLHREGGPAPVLYPISPNPASPESQVEFYLPAAARAQLRVLDGLGREVARLHDGPAATGWHRRPLGAAGLAPGLYFVQLRGPGFTQTSRFVVQ